MSGYLLYIFIFQVLTPILGLVGVSPNEFRADDGKQEFLSPFTDTSNINSYGHFILHFTQNNALTLQEIATPSLANPMPRVYYAVLPLSYNYWEYELQRLYENYIFHRIQINLGYEDSLKKNYDGYNFLHSHFYKNEPRDHLHLGIYTSFEWQTPFIVYEFISGNDHANTLQLDYELFEILNNLQWITTYNGRGFYGGSGYHTLPGFYGLQPLYKTVLFTDHERFDFSKLDWLIPYEINNLNYFYNIHELFESYTPLELLCLYGYLELIKAHEHAGILSSGFHVRQGLPVNAAPRLSNINEYFILHEPESISPLRTELLDIYQGDFVPQEQGNEYVQLEPNEFFNLQDRNSVLNLVGYLGQPSEFIDRPIDHVQYKFRSVDIPAIFIQHELFDEHSVKLRNENKIDNHNALRESQEYYKFPKKRDTTKIIPHIYDNNIDKQHIIHEGSEEYTPSIHHNYFGQLILPDFGVNKELIEDIFDTAPFPGDIKTESGNKQFYIEDYIPNFGDKWDSFAGVQKPSTEYAIEVEVKAPITIKEEKKLVHDINSFKVGASENIIKTEATSGIIGKQQTTKKEIKNVGILNSLTSKQKDIKTHFLTTLKSSNKDSKKDSLKLPTPNTKVFTNRIMEPKITFTGLPNINVIKEVKPIKVKNKLIVAEVNERIANVRKEDINIELISLNKKDIAESQKLKPKVRVTKHLNKIQTHQHLLQKESSVIEEKVSDFKKNLHVSPKEIPKPRKLVKSETPFLKEPTLVALSSKPDIRVENVAPIIVDMKLPIHLKRPEGKAVLPGNVINKDFSNVFNKNNFELPLKPKISEEKQHFDDRGIHIEKYITILKTPEQRINIPEHIHSVIHTPKAEPIINQVSAGHKLKIFEELKTHKQGHIVTQEVVKPIRFEQNKHNELFPLVVTSPNKFPAGDNNILDVMKNAPVFSKKPTTKLEKNAFFIERIASKSLGQQTSNLVQTLKTPKDEKHYVSGNTNPFIKFPLPIKGDKQIVSPKIYPQIGIPKKVSEKKLIQPILHKGKTDNGSGWKNTHEINSVLLGENKLNVFEEVKTDINKKEITHEKVLSNIPFQDKLSFTEKLKTMPENKIFFDRLPVRISDKKPFDIKNKKQEILDFRKEYLPVESKHRQVIKNEANIFQNSHIFSTERFKIEEKGKFPTIQKHLNRIEIPRRIQGPSKENTPLKVDSKFPYIPKDANIILRKELPPKIVKEKKFPFSENSSKLEFERDFFGDKLKKLNLFDKGSEFFREEKLNVGSKDTFEGTKPEILDHQIPIVFKGTKPIFIEDEKSLFPENLSDILLKGNFRNSFEETNSSKDKNLFMTHDVKPGITFPKLFQTLDEIGNIVRRDSAQNIKQLPIEKEKHNFGTKKKIDFPHKSDSFGDIKSTLSKEWNILRKENDFKEIPKFPITSEKSLPSIQDFAKLRKADILQKNNNPTTGNNIFSHIPAFIHPKTNLGFTKGGGFQGLRVQEEKRQGKETKIFEEKRISEIKSTAVAEEDPILKKHISGVPVIVKKQVPLTSQSTLQDKVSVFEDLKTYSKKEATVKEKVEPLITKDYKSIEVDRAPNSLADLKKNNIQTNLKFGNDEPLASGKEMLPNMINTKMPVIDNSFNSPFNSLPGPNIQHVLSGDRFNILPDNRGPLIAHKTPFLGKEIKSPFAGDKNHPSVNYKIPSLFGQSKVTISGDIKTQDKLNVVVKENQLKNPKQIIYDEALKLPIVPIEKNILPKDEKLLGNVRTKPIPLSPTDNIQLNQKSLGKIAGNKINIFEDQSTFSKKQFSVKENIKPLPQIKQHPIIKHPLRPIPLAQEDKFKNKASNVKIKEGGITVNNLYTIGNKANIFIDGIKHANEGNKLHISSDTRGNFHGNKNFNLIEKSPLIFDKKIAIYEEPKQSGVRHKKGILTKDLKAFESHFENAVPKLIENGHYYDNDEYIFQHDRSVIPRGERRVVIEEPKQHNPVYGKFSENVKSLAEKQKIEETKTLDNADANGLIFGNKKLVNIKNDIGYPNSYGAEIGKDFIISNRKGYKFEDSKPNNVKNEKEFGFRREHEHASGDKSFEVDKIKDYIYGFKSGHEDSEDYYNRKDFGIKSDLNYGDSSVNGNEFKKFDGTGELKSYGSDLSRGTEFSDGDTKTYAFGHNKDYAFALQKNFGVGKSLKYGKESNRYGKTSKQSFDSNKLKSFLFDDKYTYNNDAKKLENFKLGRKRGESLTDKFGFSAGKTFDLEKGIEKAFKIRL